MVRDGSVVLWAFRCQASAMGPWGWPWVGGATFRHRLRHEISIGAAEWGSQRVAPGEGCRNLRAR
eukprot:181322-Chlamydomonas_euryale.AAC.1